MTPGEAAATSATKVVGNSGQRQGVIGVGIIREVGHGLIVLDPDGVAKPAAAASAGQDGPVRWMPPLSVRESEDGEDAR